MTVTTRTIHGDADLLSAYLDGELETAERRAVEEHLSVCAPCRADLQSLRRVVSVLRDLERHAPPPVLAERVGRRVAVAARRAGLVARLEAALRDLPVQPATLLTFGVVVALAAIAALFVAGVGESGRRAAERTVTPSGQEMRVVTAVVGERTFDREGALWIERGAGEPERTLDAASPETVRLLEREPRLLDLLAGSDGVVLLTEDGETVLLAP